MRVLYLTLCVSCRFEYVKEFKQAHRRDDDIAIVNAGTRFKLDKDETGTAPPPCFRLPSTPPHTTLTHARVAMRGQLSDVRVKLQSETQSRCNVYYHVSALVDVSSQPSRWKRVRQAQPPPPGPPLPYIHLPSTLIYTTPYTPWFIPCCAMAERPTLQTLE